MGTNGPCHCLDPLRRENFATYREVVEALRERKDLRAQLAAVEKERDAALAEGEYDQINAAMSQRESVAHLATIYALRKRVEELEAENSCDVCVGGKAPPDQPCVCVKEPAK
jgi:hypothetical protein